MNLPLFSFALLVEDEPQLAMALQVAIRKLGIPVDHATTLEAAYNFLKIKKYELIILDRTLPDGDGLSLCRFMRNIKYSGMILVLTASGQLEDRVEGLNSGADDYLPKPFSWEELEARIRALARRKVTFKNDNLLSYRIWQLDEPRLRIFGPQGWVELTPLEFKLAAQLIQNKDRIISRSELLKSVWGFTLLPKTRTVDHFLGRLRKYFEKNPESPKHFITIRGAGYRFVE